MWQRSQSGKGRARAPPLLAVSSLPEGFHSTLRHMAWRTCSSEQMGFDEGFLKVSLLIIRAMLACIIIPRLGPNYKAVLLKPPQSHHVPPRGPGAHRELIPADSLPGPER